MWHGLRWRRMAPVRGCGRDLLVSGKHALRQEGTPVWVHRQPRAVYKHWARLRRALASGCRRPCEHQRQFPAVQGVRPVGASDPVLLQSVGHSCCGAETSTHSAYCAEDRRLARCSSWGGCRHARLLVVQTVQSPCWCRRCSASTRGRAAVNMQPKFQQVSARGSELVFCSLKVRFSDSVHSDVESRLSADFLASPR